MDLYFLEAAGYSPTRREMIAADCAVIKLLPVLNGQLEEFVDADSISSVFETAMDAAMAALKEGIQNWPSGYDQVNEAQRNLDYYNNLVFRFGIDVAVDEPPRKEVGITRDGGEPKPPRL